MTKTELIQALESKFYRVDTPVMQVDYGNLRYYLVKVYDLVGDAMRDANLGFYVADEGGAEETAYWSGSEPKPTPVSGFQQEVTAYVALKIADDTIEGAFAETIDAVNETAIYRVVMPDLTEKRLFVDKDGNGDLRHRALV